MSQPGVRTALTLAGLGFVVAGLGLMAAGLFGLLIGAGVGLVALGVALLIVEALGEDAVPDGAFHPRGTP